MSADARERSREWFLGGGASSVLWGRFLPGLRSVISIPAGLVGMRPTWFGGFTAVGTLAFYATVALVVHLARERHVFATVHAFAVDRPATFAVILLGTLGAIALVTVWYRKRVDVHETAESAV